jgi:hypothetical protein
MKGRRSRHSKIYQKNTILMFGSMMQTPLANVDSNRIIRQALRDRYIYDPVKKEFIMLWEAVCSGLPWAGIRKRLQTDDKIKENLAQSRSGGKRFIRKSRITWHLSIYNMNLKYRKSKNKQDIILATLNVYVQSKRETKRRNYRLEQIEITGTKMPSPEEIQRLAELKGLKLLADIEKDYFRAKGSGGK